MLTLMLQDSVKSPLERGIETEIMSKRAIHIGHQIQQNSEDSVTGAYVRVDGEQYYCIENFDRMDDFFISLVSDSNHWMFISTLGGLTAGRVNAESALFPYYSDDKIRSNSSHTGSRTLTLITRGNKTSFWAPFSESYEGIYKVNRKLYKNVLGDKIIFEEKNQDLLVTFRYAWRTSQKFGFVKTSTLINNCHEPVEIDIVDGIENLLPYGVESGTQNVLSCLVDAYKKNELNESSKLALYTMSSILVDRAEPSEALSATTVWSSGLPNARILLSSLQLQKFREGTPITKEIDIFGRRGAYFVNDICKLSGIEEISWDIVAEVNQGPAKVRDLIQYIKINHNIKDDIESDISLGSTNLCRIVATADGLQIGEDLLSVHHHYSNVLFNVLRGGVFENNYRVLRDDLLDFIKSTSSATFDQNVSFVKSLDEEILHENLIRSTKHDGDESLQRICYEYLPLSFSRRHGDPSRPWNQFNIQVQHEDGTKLLNFEGNWRDIFQNWEALCFSIPGFAESMICKFVNASTFEGYNPYRITRDGIDWETLNPADPWSSIGYWGDHQIIYLLKLLEFSGNHHPERLREFLTLDIFCYANVPYKIKPYSELLNDPFSTIDFDYDLDTLIKERVKRSGSDGRLVWNNQGKVYHINLSEKLLTTMLGKLCNFIPGAGIWMNTQRPEWNDANNALVGNGISAVTLYYIRRFQNYLLNLFLSVDFSEVNVSSEVVKLFDSVHIIFTKASSCIYEDRAGLLRKEFVDQLGAVASECRENFYAKGVSNTRCTIEVQSLLTFFRLSLSLIDRTISDNRRDDGLYHAYNLMTVNNSGIRVSRLYEMLEGQVAVLSSGYLSPKQALEVLSALRNSDIYDERQGSYLLYPDRKLPRFLDLNVIPSEQFKRSQLLQALVLDNDYSLIEADSYGGYYFNGSFNNVQGVKDTLKELAAQGYKKLVAKDQSLIMQIFEDVFKHHRFTGRSGGMYAYEGLGCIYWHMVSKLLLTTIENIYNAKKGNFDNKIIDALIEYYFEIRGGIGFNKTPKHYGAFPTDPYSHTPGFAGAKQPGMTGQVKEEIIARLMELGVRIEDGCIRFYSFIMRKSEFLLSPKKFHYFDVNGQQKTLELVIGQMAFTYCQIPVVYEMGTKFLIEITYFGGEKEEIEEPFIDRCTSAVIFSKTGAVHKIKVTLDPGLK